MEKARVIDNPVDLEQAHKHAITEDQDHLIVTRKLMERLTKKNDVNSITYGHPGIRLFVEGTKDTVLEEDGLPAEAHREREISRKSKEARGRMKLGEH